MLCIINGIVTKHNKCLLSAMMEDCGETYHVPEQELNSPVQVSAAWVVIEQNSL